MLARGGIQLGTSLHPVELPQPPKVRSQVLRRTQVPETGLRQISVIKIQNGKAKISISWALQETVLARHPAFLCSLILSNPRHKVMYRNSTQQRPSAPLKVSPTTDNSFSCEKCSDPCLPHHRATCLWARAAAKGLIWMSCSSLFLKRVQDLSL